MSKTFHAASQDLRTLLQSIGIADWNATMVIPYLLTAPTTTDLDMAQVILVIEALQNVLNTMGANLRVSGEFDLPTAKALDEICGPGWQSVPWYNVIQAVVWAHSHGRHVTGGQPRAAMGYAMGAVDLPSMPGGMLGWLAAAGAAYYFLFREKR